MSEVTRVLDALAQGDPHATDQLLPLVYDELRKLAAERLAREKPGQTLDATALVHEAYVRLASRERERPEFSGDRTPAADAPGSPGFADRRHFFAAAAEAMRHILVDNARRKQREKHGGGRQRVPLDSAVAAPPDDAERLLALDEALQKLSSLDPPSAAVVKLRHFAGLSVEEAAETLGISRAQAYRHWTFARAWLLNELGNEARP
jgi:RNA polymerase sigma factor (sigma-70 family)